MLRALNMKGKREAGIAGFYRRKGRNRPFRPSYDIGGGERMTALQDNVLRMIGAVNELPFERVTIRSRGGPDICFHGYRGARPRLPGGPGAL